MTVRSAFLALSVCVVVASAPALGGSWVYHDRIMVGHPMMDGFDDLLPSFVRNSDDYQRHTRGIGIAGGTTYRPVATLTFVIVNATVGFSPLAHHIESVLCHLAVVYLLLRLAARSGRLGWAALLPVTAFALHPSNVEAYGWVNARADVLAGIALAGVLLLVDRPRTRWTAPALFAVLIAGALCKETFLLAAAVPIVAYRLRPFQPRALLADVFALVASAATLFALRALTSSSTVPAGLDVGALAVRFVHVARLAVETWIVPFPHAMRLVAWEAHRPLELTDWLAVALPVLVALYLLVRGEVRRAGLVAGALLALAPTLLVGDSFWLGFDRFLYLSAILVVAAALPARGDGRGWMAANAIVAVTLGVATFLASQAYRSHDDFAAALLADRPDDPTVYIIGADAALEHGRRDRANDLMDRMPVAELPVPVGHEGANTLIRLGRQREAAALIERTAAQNPADANARFDLLTVRAAQRRWDDVAELAHGLAGDRARRQAVLDLLAAWTSRQEIPPDERTRVEAALSSRSP